MKKTYMTPATKVVKVRLQRMLAGSQVDMYGTNATSAGMSRDGGFWDDEEEDW